MTKVALALLHYPVLARGGEVVTTTLTNFDSHDISRCVKAYGLAAFYIVHPLSSQRLLAERIRQHWVEGAGGKRIPDRGAALSVLRVVSTLDEACRDLGADTQIWTTAAAAQGEVTSYRAARDLIECDGPPVMLCFGTGWGLAPTLLADANVRLEPIVAKRDTGYNHLSVRSAVAISLDRLFG